jgi:hypothetical protein
LYLGNPYISRHVAQCYGVESQKLNKKDMECFVSNNQSLQKGRDDKVDASTKKLRPKMLKAEKLKVAPTKLSKLVSNKMLCNNTYRRKSEFIQFVSSDAQKFSCITERHKSNNK